MAVGVVEFSLQKFNMFSTHNHLVLNIYKKKSSQTCLLHAIQV